MVKDLIQTGPDGSYKFTDVLPGDYVVQAYDNISRAVQERNVTLHQDENATVDFDLHKIRMRVTVVDEGGTPVPGAAVFYGAGNTHDTGETDADGIAVFDPVKTGQTLIVSATTARPDRYSEVMTIASPRDKDINVRLVVRKNDDSLRCTVTSDVDGKPIENAQLNLESSSGVSYTATADASGVAAITGFPPGDYKLEISAKNYAPVSQNVHFSLGDNQEMTQRLQVDPNPTQSTMLTIPI
jgi:uncharacterized surface anchored protein